MEVILNPDLTINLNHRPYVEQSEYDYVYHIYDPNGPGPLYNLYTQEQPQARRFIDGAYQSIVLKGTKPNASLFKDTICMPYMRSAHCGSYVPFTTSNSGSYSK